MKKKIPQFIAPCLWSYDISQLDLKEDEEIIITQVLNYGIWRDLKWLYSVYGEQDVRKVVSNPRRGLWFPKVLNFWETVLEIKIPSEKKKKALFNLSPF